MSLPTGRPAVTSNMEQGDQDGGQIRSSTPLPRVDQAAVGIQTEEIYRIYKSREDLFREADCLIAHARDNLKKRKCTVFDYMGYVNVLKENQKELTSMQQELLTPTSFTNEEQYRRLRSKIKTEMLKLDTAIIEINYNIDRMKDDLQRERQATQQQPCQEPVRTLEKLRLEKFNGTVDSWIPFWTRFKARVHDNEQLSVMDKYDFLRQYCTPNVLNKLKTVPLTEKFYQTAVDRLKDEFGRQDKVMSHYTAKLVNLESIQSRYDIDGLRALSHLVQTSLTALETVGLSKEAVAPFFWPILRKALPVELYLQFKSSQRNARAERQDPELSSSAAPTAESMTALLSYLVVLINDMSDIDVDKLRQVGEKERPRRPTVATLPIRTPTKPVQVSTQQETKCLFCESEAHKTEACDGDVPYEKKKEILAKLNRCFRCTKPGHRSKDCRSAPKCQKCLKTGHVKGVCRTQQPSQPLLCYRSDALTASARNSMTARVTVYGVRGQKQQARILLDPAAHMTLISNRLVRSLGFDLNRLKKQEAVLSLAGNTNITAEVARVEVRLQSSESRAPKRWLSAYAIEDICEDKFKPQVDAKIRQQLDELNIQLADDPATEDPIDILIGVDHLVEFQTHNAIRLTRTLEVVQTAFGWTLLGCKNGNLKQEQKSIKQHMAACLISYQDGESSSKRQRQIDRSLDEQFRKFVEMDAIQLNEENREAEEEFVREFTKSLQYEEQAKRFVARLPFKQGLQPAENRKLCMARLQALEKRLSRSDRLRLYSEEFSKMVELGFIEKVEDDERPTGVVSYLPHREVIKTDSLTTKLRIVFDASAKEKNGYALNEALHTGPNLNADMLGVILNFRKNPVTLIADIEKSFPQVVIHEDDRNALRLLWDAKKTGVPQTFRLTRNYFGLAPSPFILAASIKALLDRHEESHPQVVDKLRRSYYVDDLVLSEQSDEQAMKLYETTREIFAQGSFNLRKWLSNSPKLINKFKEDRVSIEEYTETNNAEFKVLGLRYNTEKDALKIEKPAKLETPEVVTKRYALSAVSSVFDRLGMIAPVIMQAKLIMQMIYKVPQMKWDDRVPTEIVELLNRWKQNLENIEAVEIPRQYRGLKEAETKVEVHLFSDASAKAYGVVAYVVVNEASGKTSTTFLMAKSKVAPLKKETIPRLELMALVLSAEVCKFLKNQLQIKVDTYYLWTDSTSAYYQAISRNPEKLTTFVRNRVLKIRSLVDDAEIRHVPGNLNTADIVSRGCSIEELINSNWFTGPAFLAQPQEAWPQQPEQPKSVVLATKAAPPWRASIEFGRFSQWRNLRKSATLALRWMKLMQRKIKREDLRAPITCKELEEAERWIVQEAQQEAYPQEVRHLREGIPIADTSLLAPLAPCIINGLLCVGGRMSSHSGDINKNPVILPPGHVVTKLYLANLHRRNCHAGASACLVVARKRYWIPRGRQLLKQAIYACADCRRFHLEALKAPRRQPPETRVSRSAPFMHVGTDVAGPLLVDEQGQSKKIWICIFTCCATRAVHLELLTSLSTREFLMSLRRFKARRECPRTFYSDNAKAYLRAADDLKEISKMVADRALLEAVAEEGIQWKFNVEKAPWNTGFVERLIGILKGALKSTIGRQVLNYQELETVLCEVEEMMNRRPLCQVPDSEIIDVLTPLHFLIVATEDLLADQILPKRSRRTEILARWRHRKKIVEDLWTRWEKEYLSLLKNFHETSTQQGSTVKEGQVVIIHDEHKPRLWWKLGRVVTVNIGRDGAVRSCTLKLANNKTMRRPLRLLYPLEMADDQEH